MINPYIIKAPVISEKTVHQANTENRYTFLVDRRATKNQIVAALKSLYAVDVVSINTIMSQPKARRTGKKRMATTTAKQKKALVQLKEGQTIDLFDISDQS